MSAPSPPQPGDQVSNWGYTFTWTEKHPSKEEIEPLRQEYDTLGASALERLHAIRGVAVEESKAKGTRMPSSDLYTLLRDNYANDEVLSRFWEDTHTVPDWVDWEQLARGQKFFYRYLIPNLVGFAVQGFIAENSAVPGVIEVLVRTGGFSTRTLLGRILETFQWLIQITHDLAAIQPGGSGHAATMRVRLLHSSVRQRILHLANSRPSYFNTAKYGIPINTLDSIHSITAFACNPMWLQLPKFGVHPSSSDIEDYIAFFRYVSHVIGSPTEYFVDADTAKKTMESMLVHELRTTETSRIIAFNFLECVGNLPSPFYASMGFIRAASRWVNGREMCEELDVRAAGVLSNVVFMGYCCLVMGMAWLQRLIPGLDEWMISFTRKHLYEGIVNRKSRSLFDFKYIPQVGKSTGRERFAKDGVEKDSTLFYAPILSSVANIVDMGAFEMACLTAGLFTVTMLALAILFMGKTAPVVYAAYFAPHSSVAGIA